MIYDCFTFFNEIDLLEIRINTLNNIVDKFVLVEATLTHQGKKKPLYYSDNKERFKEFHHKIIHVVVDEYPSFFVKWRKPTTWDLENHQRNQIVRGLANCQPEDTVVVSDLDEIPNPIQIAKYKDAPGIKVFKQMNFYYFLNCRSVDDSEKWWYGPVMANYSDFRKPQDLRLISKAMHADNMKILKSKYHRFVRSLVNPIYKKEIVLIDEGGWHFGFLGGVKKIIEKLEAFSHNEFNKPEFKNEEVILEAINSGKDILGRGLYCEFIPIDSSFPEYIINNKEKYKHLIKK